MSFSHRILHGYAALRRRSMVFRIECIALSQKFLSLASQLVRRYQQAAAKSGSTSHVNCGPRNQQDQQLRVTVSNCKRQKLSHEAIRPRAMTATLRHHNYISESDTVTVSTRIWAQSHDSGVRFQLVLMVLRGSRCRRWRRS